MIINPYVGVLSFVCKHPTIYLNTINYMGLFVKMFSYDKFY